MMMQLKNLMARFEALSIREQILIGVTVAAVLMFGMQLGLIDPLLVTQKKLEQKVKTSQSIKLGLEAQLDRNLNGGVKSKSASLVAEIKTLKRQILVLNEDVVRFSKGMVPAQEMPRLLQVILAEGSLQLVSLNNIKPIAVTSVISGDSESNSKKDFQMQLYRHGLTIVMRGEYLAALDYLEKLEAQDWKFIWHSMAYKVLDHPIGELELHLQTLSTDRKWLGV